jgi:peptidoglycan/xylan/chitin deacetylase (PgdA/CDA1 family)
MARVCLTFDFDAVSIWVSTFRQISASPLSRGEYGARVGIPRILELLKRKAVCATFFVPAHTALSFPQPVQQIVEAGHEVASHGLCHESPVNLSREEEERLLDLSVSRLQEVLGAAFRPSGYRSPAWDLSNNSVEILESRGYAYESSMMADDYRPYFARRRDQVDEERFVPGEQSQLVELPVAWELDDYPYFHWSSKPLNQGLREPEQVLRIWEGEYDYCQQHVPDGVFTLTGHPEIIGRGPRIQILERFIDYVREKGDAVFCTAFEAASDWRSRA